MTSPKASKGWGLEKVMMHRDKRKKDQDVLQSESTGEGEGDPKDVVEPEHALPQVTLDELPQRLREAAARAGWTRLMPVQSKAIPYVLAQRDLMIQSRTGSGKTGAYILPILERIDPKRATCQALVLTPTRELARQVAKEAIAEVAYQRKVLARMRNMKARMEALRRKREEEARRRREEAARRPMTPPRRRASMGAGGAGGMSAGMK